MRARGKATLLGDFYVQLRMVYSVIVRRGAVSGAGGSTDWLLWGNLTRTASMWSVSTRTAVCGKHHPHRARLGQGRNDQDLWRRSRRQVVERISQDIWDDPVLAERVHAHRIRAPVALVGAIGCMEGAIEQRLA